MPTDNIKLRLLGATIMYVHETRPDSQGAGWAMAHPIIFPVNQKQVDIF